MFQNLIDDVKASTGTALRLSSLAIAAAISLFIATSFLCAALFVAVLQNYGLIAACLSGAALFFVVTLMSAGSYLYAKRRREKQPAAAAKSALATALGDPMVVAAGLQVVRTVGLKRLLPLLAIGGVAFGLMARKAPSEEPAE